MNNSALTAILKRHRGLHCFGEIFGRDGYRLATSPRRPATVLDVGANVGLFAVAVRERWPACRVFCVEPHPETFAELERTVAALGNGVTATRAALARGPVVLRRGLYSGVHQYCERRATCDGVADVLTRRLADLLPMPFDRPLFVKIDVEGAERSLVGDPEAAGLIRAADWMAMELHFPPGHVDPPRLMLPWLAGFRDTHRVEVRLHRGGGMVWLVKR